MLPKTFENRGLVARQRLRERETAHHSFAVIQ
jgi:hypothetical protein